MTDREPGLPADEDTTRLLPAGVLKPSQIGVPGAPVVDTLAQTRWRLERYGWCGFVVAAIWFLIAEDWWATVVLTVTWAIAIVWLRGLAAQVRALSPDAQSSGIRLVILRLGALVLGLLFLTRLGTSRPAAMTVGLSLVPLALLLETTRQLLFKPVS